MDILSKRMRDLREDSDMKQSDLSRALDMSQSALSQYENGREPPLEVIFKYMKFFDVSVEYLLGISNERKPEKRREARAIDAMQSTAVAHGDKPFSRADIVQLAGAFVGYYKAGAPAGSVPMECVTAFLPAVSRVLDAAARQDVAALLAACDDVAKAGLSITGALGNVLGVGQDTDS